MSEAATPPDALQARQRALWQGAAGVLGAIPVLLGGSWLLEALGSTRHGPLLVVVFLGLAAEIFGVWRLGVARDSRWDLRGVVALALMCLGYPLLFLHVGWFTMGLYFTITGQPVRLFGD